MRHCRISIPTLAVAAAILAAPSATLAQDINKKLADLDLGIVAITVDMQDGQFVGERSVPNERRVETYRWDVEITPVEHFRFAGLPVDPGKDVSFTEGIFGRERFRLAGRLTALDIRGDDRIEVRTEVVWSVYDSKGGEVIAEMKSKGLAKGAVLGIRGEQPNALMDSVIHSLEEFLDKDGGKAIKAARG
jgi:hypothetical protein